MYSPRLMLDFYLTSSNGLGSVVTAGFLLWKKETLPDVFKNAVPLTFRFRSFGIRLLFCMYSSFLKYLIPVKYLLKRVEEDNLRKQPILLLNSIKELITTDILDSLGYPYQNLLIPS